MSAFCEQCQAQEAVVHITELKDGQKQQLHLCEECAEGHGIPPKQVPGAVTMMALKKLMEKSVGDPRSTELTCPDCGLNFAEFKAKGRFGCAQDYDAFLDRLLPLLQRIHGAVHHVWDGDEQAPEVDEASAAARERVAKASAESRELTRLRRELQDAVKRERYEDAASLRDRIRALEGGEETVGDHEA